MTNTEENFDKIVMFKSKDIRRKLWQGEWWFVINDVVVALTDSVDPARYVRDMRRRDPEIAKLFKSGEIKGAWQIDTPLELTFQTAGGKQKFKCWNTEGIFRLVQSIPSKKAEPFKRWLARVGYERVQEIENPELAQKRMKALYRLKGYPDSWIERRVRGIAIRHELTDEWGKRGIDNERDYAILTAEIAKGTFDVAPSQHKKIKGIKRENLRDHMTELELLFSQLGEASTTEIARVEDAQGMGENTDAAQRGGAVAGVARERLEAETGKRVVSSAKHELVDTADENFHLPEPKQ
ncbi:MAG: Bro-N domain-containing protein [Coriobacteriia bacterium]|nr:Bro-N domain-containing protein [Coriobacteriia bacterium]